MQTPGINAMSMDNTHVKTNNYSSIQPTKVGRANWKCKVFMQYPAYIALIKPEFQSLIHDFTLEYVESLTYCCTTNVSSPQPD